MSIFPSLDSYNEAIENNAKRFGYKAANLINLRELVNEFRESTEGKELSELYKVAINVPEFSALDGKIIEEHLNAHAPEWRKQFDEFVAGFNESGNKNNLSKAAISAIEQLQATIKDCFEKHPLSAEDLKKFLSSSEIKKDDLLMVRSTGIHEDKADLANPGGNESLPSHGDIKEISKAIGVVAASYIGAKSLSQRLIAGDQHITEFPVMPVLVQKMVGASKDAGVFSGVIYSGDGGGTRVQAAPGHGELVVNSKGRVDNYYISPEGIVYAEIRPKEFRLSPEFDQLSGRLKLSSVDNPPKLQYAPSLSEGQGLYLHEFSKFLEKQYGKRMDIEFVYDMDTRSINIVQARAIPEGSRKGLEPSSLSPEFLSKNKNELTTVKAAQVITPEVNKAMVITAKEQLIIAQTIEEALSKYNSLGKDGKIEGVIVQNPAPDTSHEAGVFNSAGISVMQVKDIEKARELLNSAQPIIMDPQNSKIHQLHESLFNIEGKNQSEIEEQLYEEKILAKGIYASTLSSYVSSIPHDLPKIEAIKGKVDLQDKTLGELLAKAKSGNLESTKDLLSIAHAAMSFTAPKKPIDYNLPNKAYELQENLSSLSTPKIGETNETAKAGLGYVLRALTDGQKKGIVSKELFKQGIIAGTELYVLLDKLEQTPSTSLNHKEKDKAYLIYFNSQKKFEGLVTGEGESLTTSLFNNQYAKIAETLAPEVKGENKAYLIESLKLSDYFLSDETKKQWQEFCAKTCQDETGAGKLGNLVSQVVGFNAHSKWVNVIFPEVNDKQNSQATLEALQKGFEEVDLTSVEEARKLIKALESQIPNWAEPAKFEEMHKTLQENLKVINEKLAWNKDANNLQKILVLEQSSKLTDVMDKSIKSLQRSALYQDEMKDDRGNVLQVARMFEMVKDFHGVMKKEAKHVEFSQKGVRLRELAYAIDKRREKYQEGKLNKSEFNPSPSFDVNSTTIDITRLVISLANRATTLEDIFTSIHQNKELINSNQARAFLPIIEKQYTDVLKEIDQQFNTELRGEKFQQIVPSTQIEIETTNIRIIKNIPLRAHACKAEIKYNFTTKVTSIDFSIFGPNVLNRWEHMLIDNTIDLFGSLFIEQPHFDSQKQKMKFEIKIDDQKQIPSIVNSINKSIENSYKIHPLSRIDNYINNLVKNRIKSLTQLSNKNFGSELDSVKLIPKTNFSWQEYKILPDEQKRFFIESSWDVKELLQVFPIQYLYKLNSQSPEKLEYLTFNKNNIFELAEIFSPKYLENLHENKPEEFKDLMDLFCMPTPNNLLPKEDLQTIHAQDAQLFKVVIQNYEKCTNMLEKQELFPQDLKNAKPELLQDLLSKKIPLDLFKELTKVPLANILSPPLSSSSRMENNTPWVVKTTRSRSSSPSPGPSK